MFFFHRQVESKNHLELIDGIVVLDKLPRSSVRPLSPYLHMTSESIPKNMIIPSRQPADMMIITSTTIMTRPVSDRSPPLCIFIENEGNTDPSRLGCHEEIIRHRYAVELPWSNRYIGVDIVQPGVGDIHKYMRA